MSEIQKINGNSGSSKSILTPEADWADDSFGDLDNVFESGDSNGDSYQRTHVTLDQIKDLERKVSSQKNLQGKDQDLLKFLSEAEKEELEAEKNEKFTSVDRKDKAEQLHEEVDARYQKVALALNEAEGAEAQAPEETPDGQINFSKEERNQMAKKIEGAQKKVGYVHYDYREDNQQTSAAYIIGCFVTCGAAAGVPWAASSKEYFLKGTCDRPYTVGYYNTNKHEVSAGLTVRDGKEDHTHLDGDHINQYDFQTLETQHKTEAEDVLKLLPTFSQAIREDDPEKQKKLWASVSQQMDSWNTKNQDKATVYHRAQLLFNVLVGELGQNTLQKAIQGGLIPTEVSGQLSQLLQSQPQEEKDQIAKDQDKKSNYFRGGANEMNWDNTKCARFMSGDFLYEPIQVENKDQDVTGKTEKKTDDKTTTSSN